MLRVIAAVLLLTLAAVACGGEDSTSPSATTTGSSATPPAGTSTSGTPAGTANGSPGAGGSYAQVNGGIEYTTANGQKFTVPTIVGLHAEIKDTDLGQQVQYFADSGNSYHLNEGDPAGVYYPNAVTATDNLFTALVTPTVGLRSEVIQALLDAAGPSGSLIFPLPFDATFSAGGQIVLQDSVNTSTQLKRLFVRIPAASKMVFPVGRSDGSKLTLNDSSQDWGTVVGMAYPDFFAGKYTLNANISRKYLGAAEQLVMGDEILVLPDTQFNDYLTNFYSTSRSPVPLPVMNTELYWQSYASDPASRTEDNISTENILKAGGAPVFVMSNYNPLFGRPTPTAPPRPS
jgi:hypothetical protein